MYTRFKTGDVCRDYRFGNIYVINAISPGNYRVGVRDVDSHEWGVINTDRLIRLKHHTPTFEEITGFESALSAAVASWRRNPRFDGEEPYDDEISEEDN